MSDLEDLLSSLTPVTAKAATAKLLQALHAEDIDSLVGLRDSLRTSTMFDAFVLCYSLDAGQVSVLTRALKICSDASALLDREVLQRAQARVIPLRMLQDPTNQFETSQKFRRIESQAQRLLLGTLHTSFSPLKLVADAPSTMKERLEIKKTRVLARCRKLFNRIGHTSPRYRRVFDTQGNLQESLVTTMDTLYFGNAGVDTVSGYCAYTNAFLDWLTPICLLGEITEFEVCAYLRDQRARGANVPSRHRYALVWAEECFQIKLFTGDRAVRLMSSASSGPRDAPIKAKCPTVALIKLLEKACCDDACPIVIRIMCGLMCCLTHGVLRWSDFQRSVKFFLGEDLLTAKSTMKRRDILIPWVAARRGFSGTDWASAFTSDMEACGMPGDDFVLLEPCTMYTFERKPATYARVVLWIRTALIHVGLSSKEAISFTLHGFRQLYPTFSNQLALPALEQEAIGHWKKGSAMPQQYDATTNSLEIRAKQQILQYLENGYDLVRPGQFLMEVPSTPKKTGSTSSSSTKKSDPDTPPKRSTKLRKDVPLEIEYVDVPLKKDLFAVCPIQVSNTDSHKIHLHGPGTEITFCQWACGTVEDPHIKASFEESATSLDVQKLWQVVCSKCYSAENCKRAAHLIKLVPFKVLKANAINMSVDPALRSMEKGADLDLAEEGSVSSGSSESSSGSSVCDNAESDADAT